MNSADITPSIFDASALVALKRQTKANDPAALKAAAQQFEALFLQMVLKSMRDATPKEGMFDSEQTRLYESLLDQQMGQVLAAKGGTGLAALIEKQLARSGADQDPVSFDTGLPFNSPVVPRLLNPAGRTMPLPATDPVPMPLPSVPVAPAATSAATPVGTASSTARDFIGKLWPHAVDAGRSIGIPAEFLVGQAALETGWGRSEPRRADGQSSHNVFGIKAGRSWTGPTVEATTTEYVDGVAQQRAERFRAYGSYAEAFRDYANLLASNPRYAAVLGSADATTFAQSLKGAGYATDPAYADKLTRIIGGFPSRTTLSS